MRILLSSVFGPYGVDDAYGRKENVMELFHNQVTREQGMFSLRFQHQSFGLYFIAENLSVPVRVLDFPSEQDFIDEIKKGYDYVGISFIVPNFAKAKRMAELVRAHAPESKIVLGGHGTHIPDLEQLIEHDHICTGEGVTWFRRLLGERTDGPFRHPALRSVLSKRVLGIPLKVEAAVLIPGVGCPNGCRFCCTSHFFDTRYTSFFDTGQALFDACADIEERMGLTEFFVMDENFLKRPQRARELMRLMEKHGKYYKFGIFSSAEAISAVGVEFMARLGVTFVWIGVESKQEVYKKNRGIELKALIKSMRDHGITVLASGILFLEHHNKETIWEDVDFVIDLASDCTQFMQLGPMPTTPLYRDYEARGLLRTDVPFEEWHGQHRIWFHHPAFTAEESEQYLRRAFQLDYDRQGSSLLRMCDTAIRGCRTLARYDDPLMQRRAEQMRAVAQHLRPALGPMQRFAHNNNVRRLTKEIAAAYQLELGPLPLGQRLKTAAATLLASREAARVAAGRNQYQPRKIRTSYRMSARDLVTGHLHGKRLANLLDLRVSWTSRPVIVELAGTLDHVNTRALAQKISRALKREHHEMELRIDRLRAIEDRALSELLTALKDYRERVRVVFEEGAEAVREAINNLPKELAPLVVSC